MSYLKKALIQKLAAAQTEKFVEPGNFNPFLAPFDIGAGAAKGAAVGAGTGLVLGSGLSAALTWALMKNPSTRDYIQNMLSGGALGSVGGVVLGGPAGGMAGLVNPEGWGMGRDKPERQNL